MVDRIESIRRGDAGNAVGQLKWFATGDVVPSNYALADGGFVDPKVFPQYYAQKAAMIGAVDRGPLLTGSDGGWPAVFTGFYPDRSARKTAISDKYVVMLAPRGDNANYIYPYIFDKGDPDIRYSSGVYTGTEGQDTTAWSFVNGYYLLFDADRGLHVSLDPTLAGLGFAKQGTISSPSSNTLKPIYFAGLYISGNNAEIRTCVGPGSGSWLTWTARTLAGRTGNIVDVVTNASMAVALTSTGQIWKSLDGMSWTLVTTTGLPASVTYSQLVCDGTNFAIINAADGLKIWTSVDAATWVERTGMFNGAAEGQAIWHIYGSEGTLGATVQYSSSTGVLGAVYSVDGGATWIGFVGWDDVSYRPGLLKGQNQFIVNGASMMFFSGDQNSNIGYRINARTSARRPKINATKKGALVYTPYVRMR